MRKGELRAIPMFRDSTHTHHGYQPTFTRRKREALVRTVTLESAIAAAARMGLRNPYSLRKEQKESGSVPDPTDGREVEAVHHDGGDVAGRRR
jgi:hypothetical protein